MSMQAGYSGMNLQYSANHIFLLDPPLDQDKIVQLQKRIHRQGQKKPCYMYHMAVAESVEERMIQLRHALADGNKSGLIKFRDKGQFAAAAADQNRKQDDANNSALARLPVLELMKLIEPPAME